MNRSVLATLATAVCVVFLTTSALGDIVYSDGATHTINTALPVENVAISLGTTLTIGDGGAVIGVDTVTGVLSTYAVSADHSTVNLSGGQVAAGTGSFAYGIYATFSTVNINSGTVTGGNGSFAMAVSASNSVVNVYGGNVTGGSSTGFGDAISASNSIVNVYGGTITGCANANESQSIKGGTVNLYSGTLQGDLATDNAANVYGGTITMQNAFGRGLTTNGGGVIEGGLITGSIQAQRGTLTISGGTITSSGNSLAYGVECYTSATVDITGGKISASRTGTGFGAAIHDEGGTVNISGGDITYSGPSNPSLSNGIQADSGTVNIFGVGFDYAYGPIMASDGTLTGTLADGSAIDLTFHQNSAGEIILHPTPEPATLSLLALGGIAMLRRRKAA